jgi:hypothetical protein
MGKKYEIEVEEGYELIFEILKQILNDAQYGKGKERHSQGRLFNDQPMLALGRKVGPGFVLGQVMKKLDELETLDREAQIRELLGAGNYLVGTIKLLQEGYKITRPNKEEIT